MLLVSTGRAFLWDSLPLGFKIFNVASAAISIVYLVLLFRAWRLSPGATSTTTALADAGPGPTSPTTDAERAEAAAAAALAAAKTAQAAAAEANSAAERAGAAAAVDERAMAASSVGTFVTLGVAAAAVLLTGAGVLLGVEGGAAPLPRSVFTQLVIATAWLVASLLFGAISASYVITHIGHTRSVAAVRLVIVFAAAQFLALVVGALDFMLSIVLF